ncbi:MAG: O-antigen ligase family protein [Armatimonadetes bacterium]|nr:O-antigen ligase family protein [Armatimonadota bacterium]
MGAWLREDLGELLHRWVDRAAGFLIGLIFFFPAAIALWNLLALLGAWFEVARPNFLNQGVLAVLAYILTNTDSGGQLANGAGVLRGLALLAGALWLLTPHRLVPGYRPLLALGLLFLALALASALQSTHVHDAVFGWMDLLSVGLAFGVTSDLVSRTSDEHPLRRWVPLVIACMLLALPVAYLRYAAGFEVIDGRMRGSFFHPNMLTAYLLLFYPVFLARYLACREFARSGLLLLALVLCSGGLLFAGSRTGVGLMLIATVVVTACIPRRDVLGRLCAGLVGLVLVLVLLVMALRSQPLVLVPALVLGGLLIGVLARGFEQPARVSGKLLVLLIALACLHAGVQSMAGSSQPGGKQAAQIAAETAMGSNSSLNARFTFWAAAWRIALEHPWLGVGPEGFHRYYTQHQTQLQWFSKFAHSFPMTVLCELGFPAALVLTAWILYAIGLARSRLLEDQDDEVRVLRLSLLIGAAAFFLATWTDVQWQFLSLPLTMAVLLGLAVGTPPAGQPYPDEDCSSVRERSPWSIRPGLMMGYTVSLMLLVLFMFNGFAAKGEHLATLAGLASQAGEHQAAIDLYRMAIELDPLQGEHYRRLGILLLADPPDEDRKKMLMALASRAVQLDGHRAVAHDFLGKVSALQHGAESGRPHFRRALELDPVNYPSFYASVGESYRPGEEALRIYQAAVERFPEEEIQQMMSFRADSVRKQLSQIYGRLGGFYHPVSRARDAERLYRRALELDPGNPAGLFGLANLHVLAGHPAQALPLAVQVYGQSPTFAPNLDILRKCYQSLGMEPELRRLPAGPPGR